MIEGCIDVIGDSFYSTYTPPWKDYKAVTSGLFTAGELQ